MKNRGLLVLLLSSLLVTLTLAQERTGRVFVRVTPDRADWTYSVGEQVTFHISAVMDGHPLPDAVVEYAIGPEMVKPTLTKTVALPPEGLAVSGGTMQQPGFLRCVATVTYNGRTYRGLATAAFDPLSIRPVTTDPDDFDEFWNQAKAALSEVPIDARLRAAPYLLWWRGSIPG
ncbi:MAG TPA: hypothetical protein PLP42_19665 [Acidobacteriota bacterium]|nr:hypothetical protein [Acidobacteriota bacterium]